MYKYFCSPLFVLLSLSLSLFLFLSLLSYLSLLSLSLSLFSLSSFSLFPTFSHCTFFSHLALAALFGMTGWAVFMRAFVGQDDLEALATLFGGHATAGHATVFTMMAWLITLYAGIAAYYSEESAPAPAPVPLSNFLALRRLKQTNGVGGSM